MILLTAHHRQPSIHDSHHQGTRIVQNLHSTPSPGLIRLEAPKLLDISLNQKHLKGLILCAAVEILIRVMDFQHLMTSQILLALQRHLGHRWAVKLQEETQTPSDLQGHFERHWTFKLRDVNQIFSHLQRHLGHHLTVKLQEETDAFGSSPFRTSFDSQTLRQDSDQFWSSGPFQMSVETTRKD
ncbi:hypothetical protein FF1_003620 [Malus domestica]